mgnify:CR=1 FL=1
MTPRADGLLDTSVFIAAESGRRIDIEALPDRSAVSVVTLAELQAGVLAASDLSIRARRLATLSALDDMEMLPIDAEVARVWAQLRVHLAQTGRRVNVNDTWIAATAISRGVPVVTQDTDFDVLEGVAGLEVVRV